MATCPFVRKYSGIFFLETRRQRRQLDYKRSSESVRHRRVAVRFFSAPSSRSFYVGHLPDLAMSTTIIR